MKKKKPLTNYTLDSIWNLAYTVMSWFTQHIAVVAECIKDIIYKTMQVFACWQTFSEP